MSEHLDWDEARVDWTPDGYQLTLPMVGKLTERYLMAINEQLGVYSLQGLWKLPATVYVSPMGDKIEVTVQDLVSVDPRQLRTLIDEGVSTAVEETAAAIERERGPVQQWVDALTAPPGQVGPSAAYAAR